MNDESWNSIWTHCKLWFQNDRKTDTFIKKSYNTCWSAVIADGCCSVLAKNPVALSTPVLGDCCCLRCCFSNFSVMSMCSWYLSKVVFEVVGVGVGSQRELELVAAAAAVGDCRSVWT